MPWFVSDAGLNGMGGQVYASSTLTSVGASITANALGTMTTILASTPFPVYGMELFLGQNAWAASLSNTQALLSIGVAGTAVAQDVAFGGALAYHSWYFPLYVPIASSIGVQLRSAVGSKSGLFGVRLFGGGAGLESASQAVTYGQVTASSTGTAMTAPASTNTKAAWTTISAATTSPARWILVGISAPPTTSTTAATGFIDIGVGAAGVEGIIIPDIHWSVTSNEDINCAMALCFPVNLPAGVRLAARYQATSISTASRPNITLTTFG
jgi:hypothetical protein